MSSSTQESAGHIWKFFRAGGVDQVRLDTGADLLALEKLNPKLWVALSCPTRGLEFDSKTLDLIDTDHDGRIRTPDIIAAIKWAASCLRKADDLIPGSQALSLRAINDATPEGKRLFDAAKQILINLGKKDAESIAVEDTQDITRIFARTRFNGDGIITVGSTDDELTKGVIKNIMDCLGAEIDRSGQPGISQAKADQFFADAKAYSDWHGQGESNARIMRLGAATGAAWTAVQAVQAKVDDYFGRCRLAAFDPRAQAALNRQESEFLNLAAKDFSITAAEVAGFPLARVEAGKPLPLKAGINPAWAGAITKFQAEVVQPIYGDKTSLTEEEWSNLVAQFASYDTWMRGKSGVSVEKLGIQRIREILDSKVKEALATLISQDKALEPEANGIAAVEKLVRFNRDLYKLLNNYVNFRDFYSRKDKAIFQAGTLYLDQRSCDLCLTVEDAAKHATMAGLAGTYLAYCDCARKSTGEKMQIVAAFTDGDSDNLMVGRNGLFFDRKGRDWDATITKIIDNPISIRQAFWSPYKKFVRMIEEQVAKRAAAAEAASTTKLETAAKAVSEADKAKPPGEPKKFDVGVVAALGVGVGALGTALGYFLGLFKGLAIWQIPLVVVGLLLMISLPSMLIAWLKLRKRNLGPILDANGWAVNAKAKITVPFGRSLTGVAKLPPGSQRDLVDPYAEKRSAWPTVIVMVVLLGIAYSMLDKKGLVYEWTNGWLGNPRPQTFEKGVVVTPAGSPKAIEPAK